MAHTRRYRWRGFGEQARRGAPAEVKPAKIKKHPSPWSPASGEQINFLRNLRRRYGIPMNNLSKLSRADASAEIERLLRQRE